MGDKLPFKAFSSALKMCQIFLFRSSFIASRNGRLRGLIRWQIFLSVKEEMFIDTLGPSKGIFYWSFFLWLNHTFFYLGNVSESYLEKTFYSRRDG